MAGLIDSHCHLNLMDAERYDLSTAEIVAEAQAAGVEKILCVGTTQSTSQQAIEIATQFPNVYASIGVHPSEAVETAPTERLLKEWAAHDKVVAIGETGLDYHYNDTGLDTMRESFRRHIRVAKAIQKPLIIHTRDAREDTIRILQEESASEAAGVMHCFTETLDMAKAAMAMGFYISFSGIVTFKNADALRAVAEAVPLERILVETDAPYLAPVPYRGKPNRPAYVREVAMFLAALKGVSFEELAMTTTANAERLFSGMR